MVNVSEGFGSSVLGYPRIGPHRELKRALEAYWRKAITREELRAVGRDIQEQQFNELAATGLTQVPGNTFSFYDHVLDNALLFGAAPSRFEQFRADMDPLDFYFLMARGRPDLPPLELVRFFGTNYHYRQPELDADTEFSLHPEALLDEWDRAMAAGIELRPVVLGPVSLLLLSKAGNVPGESAGFDTIELLDRLLPVYEELFEILARRGSTCVQLDEPCFTAERTAAELAAFERAYDRLAKAPLRPRLLVTGQYGDFGEALRILAGTHVEAIGLDLASYRVRPEDLAAIPGIRRKRLYAGVISGTNVWRADRYVTLEYLNELAQVCPDLVVSTGTTLLHVPYDVLAEYDIEGNVADRLAFAKQKVGEVVSLARALTEGPSDKWRKRPGEVHFKQKHAVRQRVYAITPQMREREPYSVRRTAQQEKLNLPLVPATTLGSYPQSGAAREARHQLGEGRLSYDEYRKKIEAEIAATIALQEDIGLDVLVHGEHERNDMVQYFAELLDGFATTHFGWVQVYGSRCVRPPIIYGDVSRPAPMSVDWITYAQSLTDKPVKGMVTGPVTMVARSFVRQDQPIYETADQVALAIRDEVVDLERAGIGIIQVDEPALRELWPARPEGRAEYLRWAIGAFRLATSGVGPATQIHTHIPYSGRTEIVRAIEQLDADVTAIVATRSIEWVLKALEEDYASGHGLSHGVGPGVYESRSARIPDIDELDELLTAAAAAVGPERLWANPDGGLKTRHHWQLDPALRNMVAAARRVRRRLETPKEEASNSEDPA